MQSSGFRPRRQIRDEVELSQQISNQLARIVALTEGIDLGEDAGEDVFGLDDREFGEVLALLLEALVVFQELFSKEC